LQPETGTPRVLKLQAWNFTCRRGNTPKLMT